jgi:hypothetical protein
MAAAAMAMAEVTKKEHENKKKERKYICDTFKNLKK